MIHFYKLLRYFHGAVLVVGAEAIMIRTVLTQAKYLPVFREHIRVACYRDFSSSVANP